MYGVADSTTCNSDSAERKPFDEEFFYRRQARTRVEHNQARQGDTSTTANTPAPPEREIHVKDASAPPRTNDDFPPGRGSIDHGDGGANRPRPRPKKKKKNNTDADIPEPIDVDQPNNVPPPPPTAETEGSGKGKPKPKPKPAAGKAKKRTAEEMNQENEGTVAGSPMTVDGSIAPTPTTASRPKPKKPTKKQQEALAKQQAAEEAAAAAAAAQSEPPKKKTKKAQNQAATAAGPAHSGPPTGLPQAGPNFIPPAGFPNGNSLNPGLAQFNGMPMGLNLGNMPNGISEDEFLAAAEAFGAGGLDPSIGMPPMDQAPPINMPLQFQPQQGFAGLTEHMQQQLVMMQNAAAAGGNPGQNVSRQPGGGGGGPGLSGGQSRAPGQ